MEIVQKRFSRKNVFIFHRDYLTAIAKDKSGEFSIDIKYERIPDKTDLLISGNEWYSRAGYFWIFLGFVDIARALYFDLSMSGRGFWFLIGIISLVIGRISRVKYTIIKSYEGPIHILHDNKRDIILNEIKERKCALANENNKKVSIYWDRVLEACNRMTNGNKKVIDYMNKARNTNQITGGASPFYNQAQTDFGDRFIEWLEDESLPPENIPCEAFKTIMTGFGYMKFIDWKEIFDHHVLIELFNDLLKSQGLQNISNKEVIELEQGFLQAGDDDEKIGKNNVRYLDKVVEDRGHKILWFDEGSDSYLFSIVDPDAYEFLELKEMDTVHHFSNPPYCS